MAIPTLSRSGASFTCTALAACLVSACGQAQSSAGSDGEYPLARPLTTPEYIQVTPDTQRPKPTTVTETSAGLTCERHPTVINGKKAYVIAPPAPGLRAIAVTPRRIRLEWSIPELPDECATVLVAGIVTAQLAPRATPTAGKKWTTARSGVLVITYPDFLPPPTEAALVAYSHKGMRGSHARVAITR